MLKKLFSILARAFSAGGASFAAGAPVGAAATTAWPRHEAPAEKAPRARRPRVSSMTGPHILGV